jgi:hypothetical protein
MIEAHHAMHFGTRQVQCLGDGADGRFADMAKAGLHIMPQGQKRPFAIRMGGNQIVQADISHPPLL